MIGSLTSEQARPELLTIRAFSARSRGRDSLVGTFTAMYNPPSLEEDFSISYGRSQGFNTSGRPLRYARSGPRQLNFKVLLDGTGVDDIGEDLIRRQTVRERVDEFLRLTYRMNGTTHEPNFLVVAWAESLDLDCRLERVTITYTAFEPGGSPIRAELAVTLVTDEDPAKRVRRENKTSPDVTHVRTVRAGDTLPLLAREIYGSADHYLTVARANDLDHFRELVPGRELVFPPLAT